MIGVVKATDYFYVIDDAETKYDFGATTLFDDRDFELRLQAAANLALARNKPIASWLVARLAFLTDGKLGVYNGEIQSCDGGILVFAILVYDIGQRCICEMQVQADDGIAIFGKCIPNENSERILNCFALTLISEPTDLRDFTIYVRDSETGSKRTYGYNGGKLLGRTHK